jgi:membrane fusion protein, multidrug efflux system
MTCRSHAWAPWLLAVAAASTSACQGAGAPVDDASANAPTEVSVTVAPIVRTTLHDYVTGWGQVDSESATADRPPARAAVAAPVAGQVAAIQCREGEAVRQGALLFRLDSRVADVAVQRAHQAVEFAQSVVRRQEQLGPGQATSQRAYDDARQQLAAAQAELNAAEVQRQFLDVHAPIDGTVVRIDAKLGQAIDPSTILAELIDLNRLVVNAAVRSVDVGRVKRGQRVDLSPGAAAGAAASGDAPGPSVAATVEYIGAQVDSATDTVVVRARVPTTSGLRPGQFVSARILTDERRDQLAVPVESILQGPDGPEVAIVEGDRAIRTRVTTGLREGGLMQVQGDRLRDGISVVVQGAYGLPPETKIKIIGR